MKINRNDKCYCGSGKKYKSCHLFIDDKLNLIKNENSILPTIKMIKNKEQIEGIRRAGELNTYLLDYITPFVTEGITTEELNRLAHEETIKQGGIPAPLNYHGFPKSICTSINEVVCHGIPDDRKLKNGDIVNLDFTTIVDGYYGDASRMFLIGDVKEEHKKLVKVSKECLDIGFNMMKPFIHLGDMGEAIQKHAEENGMSVVVEIGGHGVGNEFHEDPYVPHVGVKNSGVIVVPNMIFTIEPMINLGKRYVETDKNDGWTVTTVDKEYSAQWEYTILITDNGAEILSH